MDAFENLESEVRGYIRSFPVVFDTAHGATMITEDGREFIDFFSGAGVLSYGHNHPSVKQAMIDYLQRDGVLHGLDMATVAKRDFLQTFHDVILKPRGLGYKMQFPGPTGTNAVEAALKLARKVTGRESVISFTNAFHGMTLGALAITGNAFKRAGAGVPLNNTASMPFDGYFGDEVDTLDYLDRMLADGSSGIDQPAAIIVETIQAEGGINVASYEWMQRLAALARQYEALLIVDDIQVGNGRTGPFFSFEPMGIEPDIVCMSKALSGSGQPMAMVLLKPEHDVWEPGEHNGTFRGNNLGFVSGVAILNEFWQDDRLRQRTERLSATIRDALADVAAAYPAHKATVRGRGFIWGLDVPEPGAAKAIAAAAFHRDVVMETSGPESNVAKVMPPLVIDEAKLVEGLGRVADAAASVLAKNPTVNPDDARAAG